MKSGERDFFIRLLGFGVVAMIGDRVVRVVSFDPAAFLLLAFFLLFLFLFLFLLPLRFLHRFFSFLLFTILNFLFFLLFRFLEFLFLLRSLIFLFFRLLHFLLLFLLRHFLLILLPHFLRARSASSRLFSTQSILHLPGYITSRPTPSQILILSRVHHFCRNLSSEAIVLPSPLVIVAGLFYGTKHPQGTSFLCTSTHNFTQAIIKLLSLDSK